MLIGLLLLQGIKFAPLSLQTETWVANFFFEKNAKNVLIGIFSLHEVFQKFFFRQIWR